MQRLRQYSQFFDRLVELVPAKYYLDTDREEPANSRFLKKNAKADAKRAAKDAAKKRKRERLDPDTAQTTLDVQVVGVGSYVCHAWRAPMACLTPCA